MEFLLFCLLALTGADNIWGNAKTDQERCQAEAEYMAKHDARRHVAGVIGNFEGVGWSTSSQPSTCTPRRRMKLTGDAIVKGKNNTYYRVRSWR